MAREKFHQMVARVSKKYPAHAQAIAAFTKRNGPVATSKPPAAPSDKVIGKKLGLPSFG